MKGDEKRERNLEKGKFLGSFVIEMLGTPKEHVKEAMGSYIARLKDDPDLEFEKEFVAEPEEKGKAFSTYAEIEVWFKDLEKLFAFCLDAMPSSVEIIEPSEFRMTSTTLSPMLNDLQAKLHEVDLVIKQLRVKTKTLEDNQKRLLQNLIIMSTHTMAKATDQISKEVGVPEEALKKFINAMVEDGLLEAVDGKWYRPKHA